MKPSSGQYLLYGGTFNLYVTSYNKYWPDNCLIKTKHVAKTMYY